jgi:hypothetical protein
LVGYSGDSKTASTVPKRSWRSAAPNGRHGVRIEFYGFSVAR